MRKLALAAAALVLLALVAIMGRAPTAAMHAAPAVSLPAQSSSSAPSFGSVPAAAHGSSSSKASAGVVAIAGAWGSQPGEFGRRKDQEANPEAPMALAAVSGNQLVLLDQVNRRVQRFRDGKPAGSIAIGGDTVQDVALGSDGQTVLLDRLMDKNVQVYDANGKLLNEVPLKGKGIDEAGDVTGVFTDSKGIYAEREHGSVVRIADANGNSDPDRPELLGRPSRDGRLLLQAEILRRSGQIMVRATDRATSELRWARTLSTGTPILHVMMLDSDRRGRVYVAVALGNENAAHEIVDEHVAVFRLADNGTPTGTLRLPAMTEADESFRPISVSDDGAIFAMMPGPNGLVVTRYDF
jgi:hypothetical protein